MDRLHLLRAFLRIVSDNGHPRPSRLRIRQCNTLLPTLDVRCLLGRCWTYSKTADRNPSAVLRLFHRTLAVVLDCCRRPDATWSRQLHLRTSTHAVRYLLPTMFHSSPFHSVADDAVHCRRQETAAPVLALRNTSRRRWSNHHQSGDSSHLDHIQVQLPRSLLFPSCSLLLGARNNSASPDGY